MKINQDLKAFVNGRGIRKIITTIIVNPCFHSVCLFRLASFFYRIHLGMIAKIFWYTNRLLFHNDIDYRANLAGGFVLIHGLGTVIGMNVQSEGRMVVYQGVTLGGNNGKTRIDPKGHLFDQPIIGKNAIIYTDAKIFGPVIIGEDVVVKAGSIVMEDIH